MEIEIKKEVLETMTKLFPDKELIYEPDGWLGSKSIELKFLSQPELDKIMELYNKDIENFKTQIAEEEAKKEDELDEDSRQLRELKSYKRKYAGIVNTVKRFIKLRDSKDKKIKNLKDMVQALKVLIQPLERKWIFVFDKTAQVYLPYFVNSIKYVKTSRSQYSSHPAYVEINGKAIRRGSSKGFSESIYRTTIGEAGMTPEEVLNNIGVFLESPDLIEEYEENLAKYKDISVKTGLQLVGHGKCWLMSDDKRHHWRREIVNLDKGGADTKLVVDDEEDRDDKETARAISSALWATDFDTEGDNELIFELPVHPFMRVFNLKIHDFMSIHVKNTQVYKYSTALTQKLVLDSDKRELIDLLVSSGGDDSKDIVQGKSGGVIIITSGPPGTGKTLTAEVFSEKVERPLYVVQCSQLGTEPDELEKHLQEVLDNAVRWNAVLLIDEADVYIRERGSDIAQNAIVGVFLRVLEYYSGVLFLTTNRVAIVDDAIISRCIAHVKYEVPTDEEKFELWGILSEQYETPFDEDMCTELVQEFPRITGRSIKQLIRLSKALAVSRKSEITVEMIKWVAKFQHLEEQAENIAKKYPVKS